MTELYLTDEELVILDGRCRDEVQSAELRAQRDEARAIIRRTVAESDFNYYEAEELIAGWDRGAKPLDAAPASTPEEKAGRADSEAPGAASSGSVRCNAVCTGSSIPGINGKPCIRRANHGGAHMVAPNGPAWWDK